MLGKPCVTELQPRPFPFGSFETGFHYVVQADLKLKLTVVPLPTHLSLLSARVTGENHQTQPII